MTISLVQPLPIGNAVWLFITPPPGALWWRVRRRTVATAFTGPDDAGAVLVADRCGDNAVLDDVGLVNDIAYFYRAYYRMPGDAWVESDIASGTPAATYRGDDIDPQTIVRDRLSAGLAVEVKRGVLKPKDGKVPVLTAPFAQPDKVVFPCVSVHLDSDSPSNRALGEMLYADDHEPGGGWTETEGWLSRVQLNIVGVSLNPDERIALRQAIQRIMTGNLPVFDAHGLVQCEFSQRDTEELEANNAPLYLTSGTFTCLAPTFVSDTVGEITDVDAALTFFGMEPP